MMDRVYPWEKYIPFSTLKKNQKNNIGETINQINQNTNLRRNIFYNNIKCKLL